MTPHPTPFADSRPGGATPSAAPVSPCVGNSSPDARRGRLSPAEDEAFRRFLRLVQRHRAREIEHACRAETPRPDAEPGRIEESAARHAASFPSGVTPRHEGDAWWTLAFLALALAVVVLSQVFA